MDFFAILVILALNGHSSIAQRECGEDDYSSFAPHQCQESEFSPEDSVFSPTEESQFPFDESQFPPDESQFPPDESQFPLEESQLFPPDEWQFSSQQPRLFARKFPGLLRNTKCIQLNWAFGRDELRDGRFGVPRLLPFRFRRPKRETITFTIYTREYPDGAATFSVKDSLHWTRALNSTLYQHYDPTKPIKIITHGWVRDRRHSSCTMIKDAYLSKYGANVNVFIMDWKSSAADCLYIQSAKASQGVGKIYAKFLDFLIRHHGANPKNIHLIGHSLGAHVSGYAARYVSGTKIGRVTGLDPAGPAFGQTGSLTQITKFLGFIPMWGTLRHLRHLRASDADFVDVIHTDVEMAGIRLPVGHADFYPNSGEAPQPGCDRLLALPEIVCSHDYSWKLFVRSMRSDTEFKSYSCRPWRQPDHHFAILEHCQFDRNDVHMVLMGEPTPATANGIYLARTS